MPPAKRASRKAKVATLPLRKTSQPKRVSPAVINLGVLDQHLGYFVRRVQIWIFQDFIRRLSRIDISPAQFSVLVIIGANEGLSQSELGATLGIERARLVRMLHLLDRRGLTERLPSAADGRRHELRLTRAGQTQLKQAKALAAQHEASLLPKLGPERYRVLLEAMREAN
jgi:DNA-binding MarR family transcriptional regulator